jgi:hypothetical protein
VLGAASCGEGAATEEPAAPPETSIEVTFWPQGRDGGREQTAVLTCDPAAGTHPLPDEACGALERNEDALAPVPGDAVCTQIFGGQQEARVVGIVRGRSIDARLNRTNGCEIARWDRLVALLEISIAQ